MKQIMVFMLVSGVIKVNFNNGAGSDEFDVYFGYATEVGSIGVDVGYVSFKYIDISS